MESSLSTRTPSARRSRHREAGPWFDVARAAALALLLLATASASAQGPPCLPCIGVVTDDPAKLAAVLAVPPRVAGEARLYIAWDVAVAWDVASNAASSEAVAATAQAVRDAGARPWLRLIFETPRPLDEHREELAQELEAAAGLARAAGEHAHFQILWQPKEPPAEGDAAAVAPVPAEGAQAPPEDYARLFQQATAVLAAAHPGAPVISRALDPDPEQLHRHQPELLATSGRGIALDPRSPAGLAELEPSVGRLAELGPRRPVVVDAIPWPDDPREVLVLAARSAEAKLSLLFFRLAKGQTETLAPEDLTPLELLAREFQGGGFLDQRQRPAGGEEAWSFLHGEAGRLRTVVRLGAAKGGEMLRFSDPHLGDPVVLDLATGEARPVPGIRRTEEELLVPLATDDPVTLLVFPETAVGSSGG
ncbi:MAG: hypothetical protein SX243_09350 [Acidobacteriota bacterium]|nr:hypothetical protein [Acidobacteriota bacterium]